MIKFQFLMNIKYVVRTEIKYVVRIKVIALFCRLGRRFVDMEINKPNSKFKLVRIKFKKKLNVT